MRRATILGLVFIFASSPIHAQEQAAAGSEAAAGGGPALGELDRTADAFFETYCRACHGPTRKFYKMFPAGDILDIANNPKLIKRGDPQGSLVYEMVATGRMPKGPNQPTRAQIEMLGDWIRSLASGAPAVGN